MTNITNILRPDIAALHEYTPILPLDVLAEQLGLPVERLIKLDANENPYGPSPRALAAIAAHPHYAIYPDPEQRHLRALLADYTGQPAERIICGAGADELIDLLLRAVVQPGDAIITCPPTFGMYAFLGGVQGARVVSIARDEAFNVDIEEVAAAAAQHGARLLFLTQPNNPTGNAMPRADIERLLALPLLVVVDEAYIEFAEMSDWRLAIGAPESATSPIANCQLPSVADLVGRYENLVVLRTFSKWAGLAGLRVGYALAHAALLPHLWKIKQPYNVNAAALAAAEASLHDVEHLRGNVARIVAERARMHAALTAFGWLHVYPSQANFLLCRVHDQRPTTNDDYQPSSLHPSPVVSGRSSALALKEALMRQGILVRHYREPRLSDCIRISIGTPAQNDAVLAALAALAEMNG